jgi:DNA-binding MarR family transcriptional regulator
MVGINPNRKQWPPHPTQKPRPGVYLIPELLSSLAFSELNTTELHVLLRFYQKRQFAGKKRGQRRRSPEVLNNGEIVFTYSEAEEMGVSASAFTRALDRLVAKGFIDIAHSGEGMYRSVSYYGISERWTRYGEDNFEGSVRKKRSRWVGFNRRGKT